jgi:hypothetical protein
VVLLVVAMCFDSWHEERFLLEQSTHQNDFGEKLLTRKLIFLGQGVKQCEMQEEVLSHGMVWVLHCSSVMFKCTHMHTIFWYVRNFFFVG